MLCRDVFNERPVVISCILCCSCCSSVLTKKQTVAVSSRRDVFNERPVGEAAVAALEAGGAGVAGPAASELRCFVIRG